MRLNQSVRLLGLASLLAFGMVGCASSRPRPAELPGPVPLPSASASPVVGPAEVFGPPLPAPAPTFGPQPVQVHAIVLVLGPGLARGFAHIGVLRALHEAKIPVIAILSAEMGSLVGALYAADGNINHFEWALQKIRNELFAGSHSLMKKVFKSNDSANRLEEELLRIFAAKDLKQFKVPFKLAVLPQGSSTPLLVEQGPAVAAIRAALAVPDLFGVATFNNAQVEAASASRRFLLREARGLNLGPVVWVDVSEGGESPAEAEGPVAADPSQPDLTLKPDLKGIGARDFARRTDAAFRGKAVVQKNISRLRVLVGLAEANGGTGSVAQ